MKLDSYEYYRRENGIDRIVDEEDKKLYPGYENSKEKEEEEEYSDEQIYRKR